MALSLMRDHLINPLIALSGCLVDRFSEATPDASSALQTVKSLPSSPFEYSV